MPCTPFCLYWQPTLGKDYPMCYQLRSTTIPQAKHHKFERLLVADRFGPELLWYSCGHDFKGKNALPFMVSNSSLRSAITSCLLSKRNLLRYSFRVAISQNALQASVCILFKPMIVVFYPFHCLKISHVLCFININAAGFVPSRLKESKRKNALLLMLSNISFGLAIVLVCESNETY